MTDLDQQTQELEDQFAPAPEAEPEPAPEAAQETSPEPEDDGFVELPGYGRVSREQVDNTVRVVTWAQNLAQRNPQAYQRLIDMERQGWEGDEEPAPAEPDDDDWVDPNVSALQQEVASLRQDVEQRALRDATNNLQRGAQEFRATHKDVSDQDLAQLWTTIHRRGMLPGFVSDAPDESTGVSAALEAAYRIEFWDRARTSGVRDAVNLQRERRRAAAAGASQRSVPRVEPEPKTASEREAAIAAAIREAQEA